MARDHPAAAVVVRFLADVRVTGDARAAAEVMAPTVACHQVVPDEPSTIMRSPQQYAEHVQDMLTALGPFRFTVTELLTEDDHVYVRWQQDGHALVGADGSRGTGLPVRDVGSAVYRVEAGRIVEYWVQLDPASRQRQPHAPSCGPHPGSRPTGTTSRGSEAGQ